MSIFKFKHFNVIQEHSAMKVGTDAMILGAFVQSINSNNALDIGTGTGVLTLMLAQKFPSLEITGVDIDEASANEARVNFNQSTWGDRLCVIHGDFLKCNFENQFDLIVSNPPYFSTTNLNEDARKAQARHTASLEIKPFIKKVKSLLTVNGSFWFIIPFVDYLRWFVAAESNGLRVARKIDVLGKSGNEPIRCILEMDFKTINTKIGTFTIRESDNNYSKEYIALTKDFHWVDLSK